MIKIKTFLKSCISYIGLSLLLSSCGEKKETKDIFCVENWANYDVAGALFKVFVEKVEQEYIQML